MAVSAIARQSEDKIMRQTYQRRKDEIFFHNAELAKNLQIAEQAIRRAEQVERKNEQLTAENENLRKRLAELETK